MDKKHKGVRCSRHLAGSLQNRTVSQPSHHGEQRKHEPWRVPVHSWTGLCAQHTSTAARSSRTTRRSGLQPLRSATRRICRRLRWIQPGTATVRPARLRRIPGSRLPTGRIPARRIPAGRLHPPSGETERIRWSTGIPASGTAVLPASTSSTVPGRPTNAVGG